MENRKWKIVKRKQRIFSLTIILFSIFYFSSCTNTDTNCDPNATCVTTKPTEGNLTLRVSTNDENPSVIVTVYHGNFENGDSYFTDTLTDDVTYSVPFERYSATAVYNKGNAKITAVDGDRVSLTTDNNCGYTCYGTKDGSIDLRLK